MSISSAIAAEYGNQVKAEWEKELRAAYEEKDWDKVKDFLQTMERFYFSE